MRTRYRTIVFAPNVPAEGMSRAEFIAYAAEVLSAEALEPLYDSLAEYNSEVTMFGDAGPGAGYRLRQSIAEVNRIEAALARMQGRQPRDFHLRMRCPD